MQSDLLKNPLENTLKYPLPVDTHLHLSLGGDPIANARLQLAAGVAAVRDAGDRDALLDRVELPSALTVVRTGPAIFKKGSYGSFLGDNRDLTLVEKINRTPSGFVKVILTGLVSFDDYGKIGPQQWSFDELIEIVKLATAVGKKVMVHVNSDQACREAVNAGVHSLEHGYFIEPETLKLMAAKGVCWTPTIAAMANQISDPDQRFSAAQLDIIKRNAARQLEMIQFAFEAGVKLSIDTDSGSYNVPHGPTFLREMELFVEAGIEKTEVWQIATRNGRELLGLKDGPQIKLNRQMPLETLLQESRKILL